MRTRIFSAAVLLTASVLFLPTGHGQDKKNVVGEIAPHPLDNAFLNPPQGKLVNGLLNDPLFQKAIAAAEKARREAEEAFRNNPNLRSGSPHRMARAAFLRTLNGEDGAGAVGALPK